MQYNHEFDWNNVKILDYYIINKLYICMKFKRSNLKTKSFSVKNTIYMILNNNKITIMIIIKVTSYFFVSANQ